MNSNNHEEENHYARSNFVRQFVQCAHLDIAPLTFINEIPKKIVQFWDNLERLPVDVNECMETWKKTEEWGVERLLFDKQQAADFIYRNLGLRYSRAYEKCYHPAMQSDYFRLCYIFLEGGCYIDADDVYRGARIQQVFNDGRLKIQPLCYDIATHTMVAPDIFTKKGANSEYWIFYFNNNPLIAGKGHPIIERALYQATLSLEKESTSGLPEIQSATGPGNLTKSIFDAAIENEEIESNVVVLNNWEQIAKSKWELSYRNDTRNWRLSNSQTYIELQS